METDFSLLKERQKMRPHRPLAIALAHCMVTTPFGSDRMRLLNKLCLAQHWYDRQVTQAELVRCKAARRGQHLAEVSAHG